MNFPSLLRKPSGFLPLVMSFVALAVVLLHVALFGTAREGDEGTAAHLWQLSMAAQVPVAAFFALRWLPQAPPSGSAVVALQVAAALVALAPVYFLNL